jgi:hypothetical protein
MRNVAYSISILAIAILAAGCTSTAKYAVDDKGPVGQTNWIVKVTPAKDGAPATATATNSTETKGAQIDIFALAYAAALNDAILTANNTPANSPEESSKLYERMAREGFAVVASNCTEFFSSGGQKEQYLGVLRDVVNISSAIAAGVIAISGPTAQGVAALGLATISAHSALDSYQKNFLFGTENISSVRILILNALNSHRDKVLATLGLWDFSNAYLAIRDNQELCQSSDIVRLVKEAIEKGKIKVAESGTSAEAKVAATDLPKLFAIGDHLGYGSAIIPPDRILAALYWYYTVGYSDETELTAIKLILSDLSKSPFTVESAAGVVPKTHKMDQNDVAVVFSSLADLSSAKSKTLAALVDTWKKKVADKVTADKALADAGKPAPELPSPLGKGGTNFDAPFVVPGLAPVPVVPTPQPMTSEDFLNTVPTSSTPSSRHFSVSVE